MRIIDTTVSQIIQKYDTDGSGSLDREEAENFFKEIMASVDPNFEFNEQEFEATFNTFDID